MSEFILDQSQIDAINFATDKKTIFAIINGGAGCGKTTIIKQIGQILDERKETFRLCAFAGKASSRLKEATGFYASTIHSMLMSDSVSFKLPTLKNITVIIDESSMVHSELLAEIVKRNPQRVILVGDQAQLPPVGAGQPFHDIINFCENKIFTLTTCYRNTEAVFKAASAIRNGLMPAFHDKSNNEQWDIHETGDAEATQNIILEWVKQGYFDFDKDIILCPKNGKKDKTTELFEPSTVHSLNEEIIKIVNPHHNGEKFKVNDRVINVKNNSDKDIWNGTTGKVHAIDIDGKMWLKLDIPIIDSDRSTPGENIYKDLVLLTKDEQKKIQHAYALTVHKAQGSQYRRVCFVALNRDRFMLDRSLVYTAITRTKEHCFVAGQISAIRNALDTIKEKETVFQLLATGVN